MGVWKPQVQLLMCGATGFSNSCFFCKIGNWFFALACIRDSTSKLNHPCFVPEFVEEGGLKNFVSAEEHETLSTPPDVNYCSCCVFFSASCHLWIGFS